MDADSFWARVSGATFANEADVEVKLVLPLLEALRYRADDIAAKYSVVFQEGRRGRKHEADFVVFDGPRHDRDTSLLVVEAMRLGIRDCHEVLKELIGHQLLDGGPIWTEEVLISRLRLLEHYEDFAFRGRPLSDLYKELSERAGEFVGSDSPLRRDEGGAIDELLVLIEPIAEEPACLSLSVSAA